MNWISIEDGLPDKPGWFLVRYVNLHYEHRPSNWVKVWFNGQEEWSAEDGEIDGKREVTHWMRIEEPKDGE